MHKIKISVVSYLNSKPFIYGLQHSTIIDEIDLALDIPAICAQKLIDGTVDIGLIPVAALLELPENYIISDYCIGAEKQVGSVMLYSNVPLNEIQSVLLDYQSRTSVALVKILATYFWKIKPQWVATTANFENKINGNTAAVIIGDRTFGLESRYVYAYDLAEEWNNFTQLPFVFACWVANKKLPDIFIEKFNQALKFGLDNRSFLIKELSIGERYSINIENYLHENISYTLDNSKKQALNLFLNYIPQIDQ